MKSAVDTNVFVALFSGAEAASASAAAVLEEAHAAGPLTISPAVYAELVAGREAGFVDEFLAKKGVDIDWDLGREVWASAGERYGDYTRARRRQRGDAGPRRILADFLVGAHAMHLADALLTSDAGIFGTYFPELRIVSPQDPSTNPGGAA